MEENSDKPLRLLSFADDNPKNGKGMLIPGAPTGRIKKTVSTTETVVAKPKSRFWLRSFQASFAFVAVLALVIVGNSGYSLVSEANVASVPQITIVDPYTQSSTALEYGPHASFSKVNFFNDTRDAFIEEGLTFVEVDLTKMQLRFFAKGVLMQSAEILGVGESGSWWETPSGLYKVEQKDERSFTTIGQAYLPWRITFQGNFTIHGWPTYPDGQSVKADFSGGGIRLNDESAQALFENVRVGTPILVHDTIAASDNFVYQPQVPEIDTPHYFIADIENGTILAASDLKAQAPIASLTKLMTAVVAAENIDLDSRVQVASPHFVTSLIPRLSERSSVSVYSLLQLLLVESSNEAAETLAGEMGREEFIEAMNAKARQLGMFDTKFEDPSGLDSGNVSSVGDLYKLTKYIYESRSFIFEITANEKVPTAYVSGEFDGLVNFNGVEGLSNFIGGKVGETNAAGQTSITLHKINFQGVDRIVVVILLGSDSRTADVRELIKYVENRYQS